jgi:hypothetical protein
MRSDTQEKLLRRSVITSAIRPHALVVLVGSCLLFGCSQRDPSVRTAHIASTASVESRNAELNVATNDACSLLSDDDVSKAFPGAASGKSDRSLESHGIHTCTWETPTDHFVLQISDTQSGSLEDELRSRMSGSIDPRMPGAGNQVRYETIRGIGDDAMLVLEKTDHKNGILADAAVMVTQRGHRRAVLFTGSSLAAGDRAAARKTLETLGRQVAAGL